MAFDQKDADLKISEQCSCDGHAEAKQWEAIVKNLDVLIGPEAGTMGFVESTVRQKEVILQVAKLVQMDEFESVALKIDGTSLTIKKNAKGAVKVQRTQTKAAALEA
ncbi:MAG: hypothetical protein ACOCNL_08560 [Acetivibrio ethanolgignens]